MKLGSNINKMLQPTFKFFPPFDFFLPLSSPSPHIFFWISVHRNLIYIKIIP